MNPPEQEQNAAQKGEPERGRIAEVVRIFLWLGVIGFGGPPAHIAMMEEEFVRRRGWLDRQSFLDALAATNIVPGPNSTEMAIHIGYLRAGRLGGVLSGLMFILPAFVLMLVLSWAYTVYGSVTWVGAVFAAVKPAVLAVIVGAAYRLFRSAVNDVPLAVLALLGVAATLFSPEAQLAALFVAGLVGFYLYRPKTKPTLIEDVTEPATSTHKAGLKAMLPLPVPFSLGAGAKWLSVSLVPALAGASVLPSLAWVFLKAGALLFGGGFFIIPVLQGDVVERYGWLTSRQFLDGVALGQSTPGPVVITSTFVGYIAAGLPGAFVATIAIFLPAFFFVLALTGPFTRRIAGAPNARAFLKGVNAAVVGSIVAAALLLAPSAYHDPFDILIFVVGVVALVRFKVDTVWVLLGSGIVGLLLPAVR